MKLVLGLAALGSLAAMAVPALAQPPGSYLRQCREVRMEGQFLHAWCRGPGGSGYSSINVQSCSTDIGVGYDGGLICGGPGNPNPPPSGAHPPAYPPNTKPYPPPGNGGYYPPGSGGYYPPGGGYGRWSATIYDRYGWRGRSMKLQGEMPNLDNTGFNDRVGSIKLGKKSGPWLVCSDANYRGRCVTVGENIGDTGQLGMLDAISSMRPLR